MAHYVLAGSNWTQIGVRPTLNLTTFKINVDQSDDDANSDCSYFLSRAKRQEGFYFEKFRIHIFLQAAAALLD